MHTITQNKLVSLTHDINGIFRHIHFAMSYCRNAKPHHLEHGCR